MRVVAAYAALAFMVLQVGDLTFEALGLPPWTYPFVVVLCIVGFPVTTALDWAFDVTPDGRGGRAPAAGRGRKPDHGRRSRT